MTSEINECADCGGPATHFGPDPYKSELYGIETEVYLCDDCYIDSVMSI